MIKKNLEKKQWWGHTIAFKTLICSLSHFPNIYCGTTLCQALDWTPRVSRINRIQPHGAHSPGASAAHLHVPKGKKGTGFENQAKRMGCFPVLSGGQLPARRWPPRLIYKHFHAVAIWEDPGSHLLATSCPVQFDSIIYSFPFSETPYAWEQVDKQESKWPQRE